MLSLKTVYAIFLRKEFKEAYKECNVINTQNRITNTNHLTAAQRQHAESTSSTKFKYCPSMGKAQHNQTSPIAKLHEVSNIHRNSTGFPGCLEDNQKGTWQVFLGRETDQTTGNVFAQ